MVSFFSCVFFLVLAVPCDGFPTYANKIIIRYLILSAQYEMITLISDLYLKVVQNELRSTVSLDDFTWSPFRSLQEQSECEGFDVTEDDPSPPKKKDVTHSHDRNGYTTQLALASGILNVGVSNYYWALKHIWRRLSKFAKHERAGSDPVESPSTPFQLQFNLWALRTGARDWSERLECETGARDWSVRLECETGARDWSERLECETGARDWSERWTRNRQPPSQRRGLGLDTRQTTGTAVYALDAPERARHDNHILKNLKGFGDHVCIVELCAEDGINKMDELFLLNILTKNPSCNPSSFQTTKNA
eukprot:gene9780-6858_t